MMDMMCNDCTDNCIMSTFRGQASGFLYLIVGKWDNCCWDCIFEEPNERFEAELKMIVHNYLSKCNPRDFQNENNEYTNRCQIIVGDLLTTFYEVGGEYE